jgi:hypothetical protein
MEKSRIVKQLVNKSKKPWNTWENMGRVNARVQGHYLRNPHVMIQCIIKESDLEDGNDLEDNDDYPKYRASNICRNIGTYGCPCEQTDCETTGAICVDSLE